MDIRFRCTQCHAPLETHAHSAGHPAECPRCHAVMTVPEAKIGPGTTLGGFRIERMIGEGGMGQVYLARQLSMDRDVAVKIVRRGPGFTEEDAQNFLREVRILARLDHPNIVTAHEAGEDDGVLFFAMTYVRGDPVERRIARDGPIPEGDAIRIISKIADALQYAWKEHRLLHRDIKPSNILLDPSGEPRLADLGLAQSLLHEGQRLSDIEGTPNYMSPEQVTGDTDPDCRSDIYSLGATLYHMVTGRLPHAAPTVEETLRLKVADPLPDPRMWRPDLSPNTVALLSGMLATRPEDRFASWEDVKTAIGRVLSGHSPAAESGTANHGTKIKVTADHLPQAHPPHVHPHEAPRKPLGPLAALVMVFLLAAGGSVVILLQRSARPAPEKSPVVAPPAPTSAQPSPDPDEKAAQERARAAAREAAALRALDEAMAWAHAHAGQPDVVLEHFERLRGAVQGTTVQPRLEEQMARWTESLKGAIHELLARLRSEALELAAKGEHDAAALKLEGYVGPWAGETAAERAEMAKDLRRQAVELRDEARKKAEQTWAAARTELAARILKNDVPGALQQLESARPAASAIGASEEAEAWTRFLQRVQDLDAWMVSTFEADAGKPLKLDDGTWTISGIQGTNIKMRRDLGGASAERTLAASALPPPERYRRADREAPPLRDHVKAWILATSGRPDMIPELLKEATDPLSRALVEGMSGQLQDALASKAQTALVRALQRVRITTDAGEKPEDLAARLDQTTFSESSAQFLRDFAADFRTRYAGTDLASPENPVLQALGRAAPWPRALSPGVIEACMAQMAKLNPGFRAELAAWKKGPDGVELALEGRMIGNISPLEPLPLTALALRGTSVKDIAPLRSMPLRRLDVSRSPVHDFSALRGSPVNELIADECGIDSLSSLRGLGLQSLSISTNAVQGISPLSGMMLKRLVAKGCAITSLTALSRMPIEHLDLSGAPEGLDLKPLRGTPLKSLILSNARIKDLSGLKGVPLESLTLNWVSNQACLRTLPADLPLRHLSAHGFLMENLDTVHRFTTLESLDLSRGPTLAEFDFLRGLKLKELNLNYTKATELGGLQGMPLERLELRGTQVLNVGPLASLPLKYLNLRECGRLTDLAPLVRCETLETLILPSPSVNATPLLDLPNLQKIGCQEENLKSPDEYRKASERPSPPTPPPPPPRPDRPPQRH